MKRKIKISLSLGILMCSILLLIGGNVKAAVLQANPQTQYKDARTLWDWGVAIRGMEATNGTMGLAERINEDTLLSTTGSNNIDVHQARSTEWGAMAILSASGYGNPSNAKAITSTTGNNTGVLFQYREDVNWEWTASETSSVNSRSRYYDTYETFGRSSKIGDALSREGYNECEGWHGAGESFWLQGASTNAYAEGYARGGIGLFSFWNARHGIEEYYTRAVVVCGQGL